MTHRKVRAGQIFIYDPVLLDRCNPPYNIAKGDLVRVVKLHGCPPPNTMGMCHVQHLDGTFADLVCTNSLHPKE